AHVGVILDAGTLQFNDPDGKSEKRSFESGDVGWRDAKVTHEVVNVGKSPMRIIEVEIKSDFSRDESSVQGLFLAFRLIYSFEFNDQVCARHCEQLMLQKMSLL